MNTRVIVAAAVAALIGLVVGLPLGAFLEARLGTPGGEPILVLTTAQDIPVGVAVTMDMIVAREMPAAYIEDRHITVADIERVAGLHTVVGVRAGESLLWTDLETLPTH